MFWDSDIVCIDWAPTFTALMMEIGGRSSLDFLMIPDFILLTKEIGVI